MPSLGNPATCVSDRRRSMEYPKLKGPCTRMEIVPMQAITNYLADGPDDRPASSIPVVKKFISRCNHLDNTTEPGSRSDSPQVRSRPPSRASSISEGHVSPEDDGPSKKVVHYDD